MAETGSPHYRFERFKLDSADGKRHYLKSLSDITAFIQSYLEAMGVRFGLRTRLLRWLSQR